MALGLECFPQDLCERLLTSVIKSIMPRRKELKWEADQHYELQNLKRGGIKQPCLHGNTMKSCFGLHAIPDRSKQTLNLSNDPCEPLHLLLDGMEIWFLKQEKKAAKQDFNLPMLLRFHSCPKLVQCLAVQTGLFQKAMVRTIGEFFGLGLDQ